jgi:hypothetical protein
VAAGRVTARLAIRETGPAPRRGRVSNSCHVPAAGDQGDFTVAGARHGPLAAGLTLRQVRRYLTYMKTTVSSKGQIVLPAEFRRMDRVEPGQEFDVERVDRGDYRLVRRAAPPNEGAIAWLLACPRKDFFVPIDSESTDAL